MSTTKKIMLFLLIDCSMIQIVTIALMFYMVYNSRETGIIDFTPLQALISSFFAEGIGIISYCIKSAKENTKGGITYELAIKDKEEEVDG